ncbi:MAG: class IV adenylate cyclase [Anaerolineales bacterium]|nr:class IV adenylate cyclase [Anaerolineales bacterium]
MGRNAEIKARVASLEAFHARAEALSAGEPSLIHQEDVFYHVESGRLKLRKLSASEGYLIAYRRNDSLGPKLSEYEIAPTEAPEVLDTVLTRALGVRGVVRKRRWLYLVGPSRIHLDDVEGLGKFVEIEIVLADHQTEAEGHEAAIQIMDRLLIPRENLVERAYIDLLEEIDARTDRISSPR